MSLAFLSKKSFNPSNISNQKRVWEARHRKDAEAKKAKEREDQLKREREDEELAVAMKGQRGGDEASLRFMYDPPPGAISSSSQRLEDVKSSGGGDDGVELHGGAEVKLNITDRHPGDDDAAAKFRLMLSRGVSVTDENSGENACSSKKNDTTADHAATTPENANATTVDTRTELEKAVGKRTNNQALTLEEQVQRFPQLKNAPMAKGMSATNVQVKFNPMGGPIRNVRCLKCGIWGHSRGDRECKLTGWDPFQVPSSRDTTSTQRESLGDHDKNQLSPPYPPGRGQTPSTTGSDHSSSSRRRRHRQKHCSSPKDRKHHKDRKRKHRHHRSRSRSRKTHRSHSP